MVKDRDMAIGFYEKIGLTLKQRWDNDYALITSEGINIGLHAPERNETGSDIISLCFM